MERKIAVPEEFPNPKSKPNGWKTEGDFKIKLMESFREEPKDREAKKDNSSHSLKINLKEEINLREIGAVPIVVSLSGKPNLKAVINWMRKHMETYTETHDGFFVKFIDADNDNRGYKVEVCGKDENGEKINWKNYKISPYIFDKIDNIEKDSAKELIKPLGGKNAEELKHDKINRYFDRNHRQKNISKNIMENFENWNSPEDKQ